MMGSLNDEIARLRGADLREQACRDRLQRRALKAAERRRLPGLRRKRDAGLVETTC